MFTGVEQCLYLVILIKICVFKARVNSTLNPAARNLINNGGLLLVRYFVNKFLNFFLIRSSVRSNALKPR